MFGRWLMLSRGGPDLLRPILPDRKPDADEPRERDAPPHGSGELSSRDAAAHFEGWEQGEELAPRVV
jgi:hypothetical protein